MLAIREPKRKRKQTTSAFDRVASGILPDVEPGFQPGGKNLTHTKRLENW
jgi:hypothetical protein